MTNKQAKQRLIELYGAECFIDKLKLREDVTPRHYTGKGQMKKMKQLTYHHILEKRNGGKATVENGALLSAENHQWFNKQSQEKQAEMNKKFQEYKKCKIELVDETMEDLTNLKIKITDFETSEKTKSKKFNRAKIKRETQKLVDEYEID